MPIQLIGCAWIYCDMRYRLIASFAQFGEKKFSVIEYDVSPSEDAENTPKIVMNFGLEEFGATIEAKTADNKSCIP